MGGDARGDAAPSRPIRSFVAMDLPPALGAAAIEVVCGLKPRVEGIRWVGEETLHLTLRFLGWTRLETLDRLEGPLRDAASTCPPIEVGLRGLGTFPPRGSPRVLWMGVSLSPHGLALQQACERAAVGAGLAPEPRAFHPHLTLGRWKGRARRPDLFHLDLGSGVVDELILYRSDLRSGGPIYTPLATYPLTGTR